MSNGTCVYGTITFRSNTMRNLERLVNDFSKSMNGQNMYFPTEVEEPFEKDMVFKDDDSFFAFSSPFHGTGRNTYRTNIECMGLWFEDALRHPEDEFIRGDDMILTGIPWSITLDYLDYDLSWCTLELCEARCIHPAGQLISKLAHEIEVKEQPDWTAKNLRKYEISDEAWDFTPEYILDALHAVGEADMANWIESKQIKAKSHAMEEELSEFIMKEVGISEKHMPYFDSYIREEEAKVISEAANKWFKKMQK